jgi:hypothetical protein
VLVSFVIHRGKMTIDSRWLRVLKEVAPGAFKSKCQFVPKCAVLDGMPLMMAGGHIQVCVCCISHV